jgi:hypothetical protein
MPGLTFLRCHGGELRHLLFDLFAATVRAHDAALFQLRHVEILGEFLVAILTEKNVLTHGHSPGTIIAPNLASGNPNYGPNPISSEETKVGSRSADQGRNASLYRSASPSPGRGGHRIRGR